MAIYTKKGDKGETSLYDPDVRKAKRISKDSLRIEAIGAIDEINSSLGVAVSFIEDQQNKKIIQEIQSDLLTIGSILAGSKLELNEKRVRELEHLIDDIEGKLPVLANFVLPGGSQSAACLQMSRSITRRAERKLVTLAKHDVVREEVLKYINRLSDTLFMLARQENHNKGIKDQIWKI